MRKERQTVTNSDSNPQTNSTAEVIVKLILVLVICLGVWFWLKPSISKDAKKYVSGLMQREQNQFVDQYDASCELSNRRGAAILVDSKKYYELKGIPLDDGYRYTLYLLLREQEFENMTSFSKYLSISYKKAPSSEEIKKEAQEFGLID